MRSDRTIVVVGLLLVLAAAAYEALVGLDVADVGDPVDGAPGAAGLLLVAIAAVGLGGLVMFACGLVPAATERLTAVREIVLVPVAAAMLLLYHHLSYDAAYAPALDRFSNRDAAPTALVVAVGVVDLVAAGLLVAQRRRSGLLVGGAGLMASAALTLFTVGGH
jgi:hypothetical protein